MIMPTYPYPLSVFNWFNVYGTSAVIWLGAVATALAIAVSIRRKVPSITILPPCFVVTYLATNKLAWELFPRYLDKQPYYSHFLLAFGFAIFITVSIGFFIHQITRGALFLFWLISFLLIGSGAWMAINKDHLSPYDSIRRRCQEMNSTEEAVEKCYKEILRIA